MPFGGALDDETILELGRRTGAVIAAARNAGRITMTDAKEAWRRVYPDLSAGRSGLLGAITNRAEAQAIRLALLFALLDGRAEISPAHLRAALAVWEYADASAEYIWGTALGDPTADDILRLLRSAGDTGKTRNEIRDHFGRNRSADEIGRALARLATECKAISSQRPSAATGGRPAEVWIVTEGA